VKHALFTIILLAIASFSAHAQDAKTPSLVLHNPGDVSYQGSTNTTWGVPSVPGTIVFYGGDTNFNDPNQEGFANENTLLVGNISTYGAVTAPLKGKITVSAVFFNNVATAGGVFDPPIGTYDIRTGLSDGNCGTELASGSGPQTAVPTGRSAGDVVEYTTTVSFAKPLTAKNGTTYWVNETPQCTNTSDSTCSIQEYYFDNTTQQTNGVNANAQPPFQMFMNSQLFGLTCSRVMCGNQNSEACKWGSWGLLK